MAYYNRKKLIKNTLNMFEKNYGSYSYQVIIVDDNSNTEHKLNDILDNYTFPIRYIEISKEEKGDRINPCVPYNKGFKQAQGKIIIIQNPECYHCGDILHYSKNNLTIHNYLTFSCYNSGNSQMSDILIANPSLVFSESFNRCNALVGAHQNLWYNHPTMRLINYHFCSAIFNTNIKLLGGFDEKFAKGHSYDDDEFLLSIQKKLKLDVLCIPPEKGFVIHQWHPYSLASLPGGWRSNLVKINCDLMDLYKKQENLYNFNYPKLLHLYWDLSNFSYLNLLTIISFNKYNFGWKINIYCPINPNKEKTWDTNEQKEQYKGKNYFSELSNINNVNIHYINFDNIPFKYKEAPEVIKSDYFRYYILNRFGGVWSDFDIIYLNNIEKNYNNNKNDFILYTYQAGSGVPSFPVGFFISKPQSFGSYFLLQDINAYYDKSNHQCLGAEMVKKKMFRHRQHPPEKFCKGMKLDNADVYLPIKYNELDKLFNKIENVDKKLFNKCIGIHWFNGSAEAKKYSNKLSERMEMNQKLKENCLMDALINDYL